MWWRGPVGEGVSFFKSWLTSRLGRFMNFRKPQPEFLLYLFLIGGPVLSDRTNVRQGVSWRQPPNMRTKVPWYDSFSDRVDE